MATSTYTGKLTDFGEAPFPDASPSLWVAPKHPAFGVNGPLAPRRVPITVASNGTFSFELIPSAQLTPPQSYILRCEWLGGQGWTEWEFTALTGGGNIKDMAVVSTSGLYQEAVGEILPPLVDAELESRDLITGTDPRMMVMGDEYSHAVRDTAGKVAFGVRRDGSVTAPDFEAVRANLAGMTVVESGNGWSIVDAIGKVAFSVDNDGRTFVGDLHPASNIGGTAVGGVSRVTVLWECGQSNAQGTALPVGPRLDPQHSRILMSSWLGTTVTGIAKATVPVSGQVVTSNSGLDPATVIARRIVSEQDDTIVVICKAAKGGSGLVAESTQGMWGVGYSGPNPHLLPIAKAALTKTLTEVAAQFPGIPVDVQIVWHQGESDGLVPYADYKAALLALIADLRSHIGDPTAPFVMGGTVPEDSTPTEEAGPIAAQIQAQADAQYAAFAPGVQNGGGSSSVTDIVHYNRGGMERLGARMHEALRRAYLNNVASVPVPALDVSARWRKSAGILDIVWSFPFCRATAFSVQYSIDGGAWQTVTGRLRELDPAATVTGLTTGNEVRVRVATINEVGTSAYTTPVTAIGA